MPQKRKLSSTNIYHVICRGNNRNIIFQDDQDNMVYIYILKEVNKKHNFLICAYCLMKNHVHLLLDMKNESISTVMKKINHRYAVYYKYKYHTIGRLYQSRFRSECIENDEYFSTVFEYIHNNPVKAEFVKSQEYYKWSSAFKTN